MATMPALSRYQQPIYNRFKDSTPMTKRDLKPTIEKVRKLLAFKQSSGMSVSRSVADLVRDFTADELVELYDALKLTPQELFHKQQR
jgi:hypothetical protein